MLRNLCAAAALLPLAIACAPVAQARDYSSSPDQISMVDQTCTQVMGLKRGETYFADCRESLSEALAARNEGEAMQAAYAGCRQRGLGPGTAAFSTWVLDARHAGPDALQSRAIAYTGKSGTDPDKSFYDVSPSVRWNRERYACAQLGLLPGSASFGHCVSGLDGAFFARPN